MTVVRPEQRLHGAVARLALGLDRQRGERHGGLELVAERAREVRHRVVARGAAGRPLPHLAGAVRGLAVAGERALEKCEIHVPQLQS